MTDTNAARPTRPLIENCTDDYAPRKAEPADDPTAGITPEQALRDQRLDERRARRQEAFKRGFREE